LLKSHRINVTIMTSQHKKAFKIVTLGCKVNQCESAGLMRKLSDAGWAPAGADDAADLVIVNTCTVTAKAAMQSRQAVRQALRANAGTRMVVTGCYAQAAPEELTQIEGVSAVVGHGDKLAIAEMGMENSATPAVHWSEARKLRHFDPIPAWGATNRTRPFLKIQDGCDAFCTYCIVPYTRGPSRSAPPDQVLAQIAALSDQGFRETVLTGIHLGCYGLDLVPRTDLDGLLARIDHQALMDRVRLSSIEPKEITESIIERVAASDRFCRHFHIPLQSGDDGVLARMGRPYTISFFRDLVAAIHHRIPDCAIGIDVLSGFPGETEAAFENTRRLLEALPITYLHVFPFSSREGTPAARMSDPVTPETTKARCKQLRRLGLEKKEAFYRKFLGRVVRVLVEGGDAGQPGWVKGFTDHYLPVRFPGGDNLAETFVTVRIERIGPELQLFGTRVSLPPKK
jgi:threonylcarbamoyladenosine tRNA methylthiotransferase MtaB